VCAAEAGWLSFPGLMQIRAGRATPGVAMASTDTRKVKACPGVPVRIPSPASRCRGRMRLDGAEPSLLEFHLAGEQKRTNEARTF